MHRPGDHHLLIQLSHLPAAVLLQREHAAQRAGKIILRPEAELRQGELPELVPVHLVVAAIIRNEVLLRHAVLPGGAAVQLEHPRDHGIEEVALAFVVPVQRALGHAQCLSDVADRHGLVAVPGKQAERRGQNPLLRIIHTMPLLLKKKTIVYNQYSKRSFTCQARIALMCGGN